MSGKKLHFGIIGAGRIGRVHAETLAFRLAGGGDRCDRRHESRGSRRHLAARCGIPKVVASAEEIIGDPKDRGGADLLANRHARRPDCAGGARPASTFSARSRSRSALDKIDMALAAVQRPGVKLQIGFNRRFDSNFRRVRQAVAKRRDRQAEPDAHHQPRSRAAADRVSPHLGRTSFST